ncbi:DUF58 domain-containing protein [Xylella fastidiosa]|uniref:DUF58 domain-containing protein n=1 Tax=Xylella fastidiosa TaxID=2371 RepID=UPI00052C8C95|nr:DUF58 domain-containing protein [Xylella fastidiosa]KAF0570330.1 membrane protein [Xylella fastidiosa subsp. fastidiosa Mus-1]KGM20577.1 membrane protein [Xylella fastidiosa]NBI38807.1 DUF58 domain-containing protein [Xylella fastidiosa subsp. fastidiosa]NMR01292.1 DUF58 domain-containing protein [Xylella fastidiosa]NMR13611.1 DUF58 domain-containing protein [Xylella fastidiosa]
MRTFLRHWIQRAAMLARPRAPESLPVTLNSQRIYMLPTPFGLFFAIVMLAMLAGGLNYNNNMTLLLALLLSGTGIGSALATHLQLAGLRLEILPSKPVAAGQPLQLRLLLDSTQLRSRPGLQLKHEDAQTYCSLLPGIPVEVDLKITNTQRGWRSLSRIRISTVQPLGLITAWSWVWPEQPLLVYPTAEQSGPPPPISDSNKAHRWRHSSQSEEMHQLRSYRAGDAARTIAWKHSARCSALLVHEYQQPAALEVLLDWKQLHTLPYEHRIKRLTRWINEAEREGWRYRLSLPGHPELDYGHGAVHHHRCLRLLALLPHV